MQELDLSYYNGLLKDKSPGEIVEWALRLNDRTMLSTSFGTYSASLIHLALQFDRNIQIVWCDTGLNSQETYRFADDLIKKYNLNIQIYTPIYTTAYIQNLFGTPSIGSSEFADFSETIKLEPFRRAISEIQPELWFTNIRKDQTAYRSTQDILSYSQNKILKVSPFFYSNKAEIEAYLIDNNLPKNSNYFDPVKVKATGECGIQFQ